MTGIAEKHSGIRLSALFEGILQIPAALDREIRSLHSDSREVLPGGLFLACAGAGRHGLDFLDQALQRQVGVVVCEPGGVGQRSASSS